VLSNGTADASFHAGESVHVVISDGGFGTSANAVAVDASDRVYLAGQAGRAIAVVKLFDGVPTALDVTGVGDNLPLTALHPFDVVVQAEDDDGNPQPVASSTTIGLSLSKGSGVLSGTLTCLIPIGGTACRFSGLVYSIADPSVTFTATVISGDALASATTRNLYFQLDPSSMTLVSDVNPSAFGQTVTFTATVTATSPTGTVTVYDSSLGIPGCQAMPLTGAGSSRIAKCVVSLLQAGNHNIYASYSGDAATQITASTPFTQVVNVTPGTNVALASLGATAIAATSAGPQFPASAINNGDRAGLNFGAGGVWQDGTPSMFPDIVYVFFNGTQTIDRVIVYSVQDNYLSPVDPSDTLVFTQKGLKNFDVLTYDGSAWTNVGSVTGNNLVKRTVSFAPRAVAGIRVDIKAVAGGVGKHPGPNSYVAEVEALAANPGPPPGGTTLVSSINPTGAHKPVLFTATVTGSNPTGTVTFTSNGVVIPGCGAVPLSGGTAQCLTSFASNGNYKIVASYSGDGINPPSASMPLSEVIKKGG
jgi:hypothetical protein